MIVYDLETYPNCFTCCAVSADRDDLTMWEISDRRNDWESLRGWLYALAEHRVEMVGFNNLGFDYPILHSLLSGQVAAHPASIMTKVEAIFTGDRFAHMVWPSDRMIPQVDLYKLHHMDNAARSTSLKALQVAMRSDDVRDLPIEPGTILTFDQMDELRAYNAHDVLETRKFLHRSPALLDFRRSLDMDGDRLNWSDKKIGTEYLVRALGPDLCYQRNVETGRREPRQTHRDVIALGDLILPCVQFQHPEFQRVRDWLAAQTITETKGVFEDVHATVDGFRFDFGTGGIHGSVERRRYEADERVAIIDVDVTSLYPSIAIVNGLAPAHLGATFVEEYTAMKARRLQHAKGTPENAALKLALNGAYGDSNSVYSPFYDPAFTMAITINGQLMLCMLAEAVRSVPGVELIQINTDGITAVVPHSSREMFMRECRAWEGQTGLDLEYVDYARMWIRDVNSYIAEGVDGKVKRKGAYDFPTADAPVGSAPSGPRAWWGNPSALVVPMAADAALRHGIDPEHFIACHTDPFDFMLRFKGQRGTVTRIGEEEQQKTLRYFVSLDGAPLTVTRPPPAGKRVGDYKKASGVTDAQYRAANVTGVWDESIHTKNESKYDDRTTALQKGWNVTECNAASRFDWSTLDRRYYVERARDLIIS